MPAFDDLTEEQMGQLIHHIRAETGNRAPKPEFIANPAGHVLKTQKQTVKAELVADGLETPWGLAFLPDGRLLVTERSGNLRIIDKGVLSEPVKGTPKVHVQQDGGMLDVKVHPEPCEERLDLSRIFGAAPGLCAAAAFRGATGACGRTRPRARSADAVDDRHHAGQAQQGQRVDRCAGHLSRIT